MGTGTYENINIKIKGRIKEDTPNKSNIFRQELKLLCMKYELDYVDVLFND